MSELVCLYTAESKVTRPESTRVALAVCLCEPYAACHVSLFIYVVDESSESPFHPLPLSPFLSVLRIYIQVLGVPIVVEIKGWGDVLGPNSP